MIFPRSRYLQQILIHSAVTLDTVGKKNYYILMFTLDTMTLLDSHYKQGQSVALCMKKAALCSKVDNHINYHHSLSWLFFTVLPSVCANGIPFPSLFVSSE